MTLYIVSIFLSAFLLFQIQPLMGKLLLPWFGGTPAVWSTLLMFFQVMLTAGYAYAYWLMGLKEEKTQRRVHALVFGGAAVLIMALMLVWPSGVTPGADWRPTEISQPIWQICVLLAISVGLPYFVLATNSTLVQVWFGRRFPGRSAYWLYAFSNTGSLLALLSYPTLIEPNFAVQTQGRIWSAAFMVFSGVTATLVFQRGQAAKRPVALATTIENEDKPAEGKPGRIQWLWVALSATASLLLLSITNQLTMDVAPIPFLWVLPLSIYLLSFIVAFSGEGWYRRPLFALLLVASSGGIVYALLNLNLAYSYQIAIYSVFLFAACMVAHGELYRQRPGQQYLSRFYLLVSVGGALGGIFINLVAPLVFGYYWEFYIAWGAILVLLATCTFITKTHELPGRWAFYHDALIGAAAVVVVIFSYFNIGYIRGGNEFFDRNFFGVLRVRYDASNEVHRMLHGTTLHGLQYIDATLRDTPTAYYWEGSGVGMLMRNYPRDKEPLKIGLLGLGAGTLAAYGEAGDELRFYEINPMVVDLAEGTGGYFSFLADSPAEVTVVLGDARISLENELAQEGSQQFDVLVLDTFSGDSVPVHLVTNESFGLYLEHLAEDGVIAVHISNRYLDLKPVLWQLAQAYELEIGVIETSAPEGFNSVASGAVWVLMSRNAAVFELPEIIENAARLEGYATDVPLWTDDFSNLIQILK